jgi:hypothetical protein
VLSRGKRKEKAEARNKETRRRRKGKVGELTGELLWPPPEVAEGEEVEKPMVTGTLNALNCGDPDEDARFASAESPGSWGNEALWCIIELFVEVEDGLEIGSMAGRDCLASSSEVAVLKGGRS